MDTTAKFYLERMRAQVESARRRQYPDAAGVPAIWLGYIHGRLQRAEIQLSELSGLTTDERNVKAAAVQAEIVSCYEDLEVLRDAGSSQVAHYLVRALKPWFSSADPNCDYLFTSGINFEIQVLYDKKPEDLPASEHNTEATTGAPPQNIVQVVMPGGALGAAFHVPLVAHEAGHVLHDRYKKLDFGRIEAAIAGSLEAVAAVESPEPKLSSRDIFLSWVEEVFADTVCGFVTGPAGFFAPHEKLRGDTAPNLEYPHNDIRVASLKSYISARFGDIFTSQSISSDAWSDWPVATEEDLHSRASRYPEYANLAHPFISATAQIREVAAAVAMDCMAEFEYKPSNLAADIGTYLPDFLEAIPPYETRGDLRSRQPTNLVSILNVAWFIAAFQLESLKIRVDDGPLKRGQLLVRLDQLILKAIELSEIRRDWMGSA